MEIQSDKYSIYIGNDVLQEFNAILEDYQERYSKIFIFCDENSSQFCLPYLIEYVPMLIGAEIIEIESGEHNKTLSICNDVWKTLSESSADRNALVVNLGGGVVCDMGGMIASLYKRGLRFFHIPTTLLSQVDASVGGKLAVNLDGYKNQIGLFRNPDLVLVVPEFLKTLPERHWMSGMAEVFKHALICDPAYWSFLENVDVKDEYALLSLLNQSISIKNNIVLQDWEEKGLRKTLNFGHTIGHAVESQALLKGHDLLHGEAISIGIVVETILSEMTNCLKANVSSIIRKKIQNVFSLTKINERELSELLELMRNDKKNDDSKINFTLLKDIGQAEFNKVCSIDQIKQAIKTYNSFL